MAEVIASPLGDVVIPDGLEIIQAAGFVVRSRDGEIIVDIMDERPESPGRTVVAARLAFSPEGFAQLVSGLQVVQADHRRGPRVG